MTYRERPDQLNCPRCGLRLVNVSVPVGAAAGCAECGGVLLDDSAFGHVRTTAYEAILLQAGETPPPAMAPAADAPLACPYCREPMTRTQIGVVWVDHCRNHGTWFDARELVDVARAIATAHRRSEQEVLAGIDRDTLRPIAEAYSTREVVDGLNRAVEQQISKMESAAILEQMMRRIRYDR